MNPPDYPLPRGGGSGWGQQIIREATKLPIALHPHVEDFVRRIVNSSQDAPTNAGWCPKKYAASNVPVIDIEKTDGKCLEVIKHLLGKAAGFTHRAAYPVAQAAVITLNADGIYLPHLMFIILKGLKKRRLVV